MVNHFEDDGQEVEDVVAIDRDEEDDFVFDEELSSNIGSSMTALEGPVELRAPALNGPGNRKKAPEPLVKRLWNRRKDIRRRSEGVSRAGCGKGLWAL